MKSSAFGRYATAGFVLASIASAYLFGRRRASNVWQTTFDWRERRYLDRNLLTPADTTFALVWPTIYAGTAGLAVHQALESQADNPRYAAARPWLWLSYALNAVFGYFFVRSNSEARRGAAWITIANYAAGWPLHQALGIGKASAPQPERTWRGFTSLYQGWLLAAAAISTNNLLLEYGVEDGSETSRRRWTLALLPMTAMKGWLLSRLFRDPILEAGLAAAFTGIAAKQWKRNTDIAYLAGGLAVVTAADMAYRLATEKTEDAQAESTTGTPAEWSSESFPVSTLQQPINPGPNDPLDLRLVENEPLK